jgi:hypothetical protein
VNPQIVEYLGEKVISAGLFRLENGEYWEKVVMPVINKKRVK